MTTIAIELPLAVKNPLNERTHWAVKAKRAKSQRASTLLVLKTERALWQLGAVGRLGVRLTRIYGGRSRRMDDDGLSAAFKHVRDAVAEHVGIDDGDERIAFTYAQERGDTGIRIELCVEAA